MSRAIGFGAVLGLAAALVVSGCGGDDGPARDGDAGPGDGGGTMDSGGGETDGGGGEDAGVGENCGDLTVDDGEECDDGNTDADDGCSPFCQLECGDGEVTGDEACDTAIAAGEVGACPTDCDDGDACTTDTLSGSECDAECVYGDITAFIDDDSCCPDGATSTDDNDCAVECGNGIVESGESCDTAIAAGDTGACPVEADCDDGEACTTDTLVDGGTCTAMCTNEDITAFIDDDSCCPTGATASDDNDCSTTCGDGVVTGTERCDTAITSGAGSCPEMADCVDGDPCTRDVLQSGGTCAARCRNPAITTAMDGDSCCPPGANETTDDDCSPVCGNGVVETGEECDDGGTTPGDGCDGSCMNEILLTAFRFTDLDVKDPHVFATVPFLGCTDVTNLSIFGINGVNPLLEENITMDGDGDGDLDLSIAHVFAPLVQAAGSSTDSDLVFPDCTAPMSSTMCTLPAGATKTSGTANNMGSGATCLGIIAGTVRPYSPAVQETVAPGGGTCYVASAGTVTFDLSGIMITLEDARIAGVWSGSPATQIVNGLIRGFISETTANATMIPAGLTGIDSIDGQPLSSLMRGGAGNCREPSPATGDKDTYMGEPGWYFYLNFEAAVVPYSEL